MQRGLALVYFYVFGWMILSAQTDIVSDAIKSNVATIHSRFVSNNNEQGFGFVVGESNGRLYLATAGHVVMEDGADPGKENANSIGIRFCGSDQTYTATILQAAIRPYDFALLEIPKPNGYVWKADCLGTNLQAGQSVGYIGRNNDCYIPNPNIHGSINRITIDLVFLDFNSVGRGTSGAPLIGSDGIIGMIIAAEQGNVEALTIERLRNEVTNGGRFPFRFGLRAEDKSDLKLFNMVKVEGGQFTMGCENSRDGSCTNNDMTEHQVSLSGFYLSKFEVTVQQFKAFIEATRYQTDADKKGYSYVWTGTAIVQKQGVNWSCNTAGIPHKSSDFGQPVVHVSYNDAVAYCRWLSKQTGKTYRLPTEAEWEYAARGGKLSNHKYAGSNILRDVAWYNETSGNTTHQVGALNPNELRLYDMSGNVWEWCADWFSPDYDNNSSNVNPQGPTSGLNKVLRGGSWGVTDNLCRIITRNAHPPSFSDPSFGFRVARNF